MNFGQVSVPMDRGLELIHISRGLDVDQMKSTLMKSLLFLGLGSVRESIQSTRSLKKALYDIPIKHRRSDGYLLRAERRRKVTNANSYRYDPRGLWDRLIKRMVAAGGKRIRPNDMRHSFASNMLNSGESSDKVAKWLGHADTRMVHKFYGHLLSYDEGIDRPWIHEGRAEYIA